MIYIGNASGILEFDGRKFSFIPVKQGAYVLSMAVDSSGRIFVGSQNEFGIVEAAADGRMGYSSLSQGLPESDQFFSNVVKTYVIGEEVFFQSEEKIFIYKNKKTRVIDAQTSFHTSFVVNNRFYVRQRDYGLMELKNGKILSIRGGEIFKDLGIFAILPYKDSRQILIATQEKGLFLFDPDNSKSPFAPFRTDNDPLLLSAGIYGGKLLHDGNMAFNTIKSGLIIVDQNGILKSLVNKSTGLRVNDVKDLLEDRQQNLWLALNNGIGRVEYGSALTRYGEEAGLMGSVNSILQFQSRIYVGTSSGLFVKETKGNITFSPVAGISGQVWNLAIVRGKLIAGGTEGVFEIKDNNAKRVLEINAYAMSYLPANDLLVVAYQDIYLVDKNWKVIKAYKHESDIIKILPVSDAADGSFHLWISTRNNGLLKARVSGNLEYSEEDITMPASTEKGLIIPFIMDERVVFGSGDGLLSLNEGKSPELKPYKKIDITEPVLLLKDFGDKVWLTLNNQPAFFLKGKPQLVTQPFLAIEAGKINDVFQEDSGVTWIGADDGLFRYQQSAFNIEDQSFPLLIRRISAKDSVVFYGGMTNNGMDLNYTFKYSTNNIIIEYAAPYFQKSSGLFYSYRLLNQDSIWSAWSTDSRTSFNGLKEGTYKFMVKARNVYGKESNLAIVNLTILPPWYRTVFAYVVYCLLFIFFLYVFSKLNSRRLVQKNAQLEKIIALRTNEIVEKNIDLEQKNEQIMHQKMEITDSINYALRIQQAILPPLSMVKARLPDSFILFKPKDIVSGDFYFFYESEKAGKKYFVFAAADCTGHGVPGAMVSMVCSNALNRSVKEFMLSDPGLILDKVTELVLETFEKSESEIKDGMDISLAVFFPATGELSWSGANNPLWLIRNGEQAITEYKANKQPIGAGENRAPFTTHHLNLNSGDSMYLFTDGYADQFGGPEGKKFKSLNLKKLILSFQGQDFSSQRRELDKSIEEWRGELEQVDDICVFGVRF